MTSNDVEKYVSLYRPQCLRYNVKSGARFNLDFMNFKVSKGMTFERVLIIPTAPIQKFITTGLHLQATSASSFYVAVTRAEQSIAIVLDKAGSSTLPFWLP